ncbi:MAG: hypothetical protein KAJ10_11695 [Thermodesulfovibrionia bacterium]|nr:hypothetical protein [Thermodesulfovibrionia bacterium]
MMKLKAVNPDLQVYLQASTIIDWRHPDIIVLAHQLVDQQTSYVAAAKNCFEWVRDYIRHSWDFKLNPVTCTASDFSTPTKPVIASKIVPDVPSKLVII